MADVSLYRSARAALRRLLSGVPRTSKERQDGEVHDGMPA